MEKKQRKKMDNCTDYAAPFWGLPKISKIILQLIAKGKLNQVIKRLKL
jgi:hypothetical protein